MTTITALNVRLGMDVSNFSEGANLAKTETTRVAAIMRQSVPASERYKQELDLLNRAFSETGKKSKEYTNALTFLQAKYAQIPAAIQPTRAELDKLAAAEKKAADDARFLADIVNKSTPAIVKYEQEMIRLNQVWPKNQQGTMAYARAVEHLQKKYETTTPAIRQANKAIQETASATSSAMSSVKRLAAAYLGIQTVAKAINLATQVEDATVAFETLTGSVNDGKVLFEQIRKFDQMTPITFLNATYAAKTMMSFGVAVQDVEKNLRMLSDITGGNNERFKMMSLAFSQMSAAGRLMGQDLLQMINAGFNPLQQISKMTGESMLQLKQRMEGGAISADEVRRAFEAATAEGGMFHGMTERLAETMGGRLNIAYSNFEKSLAAAGAAIAPLVIQLTEGAEKGQSAMDGVVSVIEKIVDGLRAMIALMKDAWNFEFDMPAFNKLLDEIEQRNKDRAAELIRQSNLKFESEKKAAEAAAVVDQKAIEEHKKAQIKAVKEWEKARLKAVEAAHKAQQKAIEEAARLEREAAKAWQRELENARSSAMKFFEEREKQNKKLRDDVAAGPGSGMEIGSTSQIKFMADQANAQIAKAAVPELPGLTNGDIARKTGELLIAQREANAKAQRQIELAERQLAEMQENGFRRLR